MLRFLVILFLNPESTKQSQAQEGVLS